MPAPLRIQRLCPHWMTEMPYQGWDDSGDLLAADPEKWEKCIVCGHRKMYVQSLPERQDIALNDELGPGCTVVEVEAK